MVSSCSCNKPSQCLCKKSNSETNNANIVNLDASNLNIDPYDSPISSKIESKKNDLKIDTYDSPDSLKIEPKKKDLSKLTATGLILALAEEKTDENISLFERSNVKDQDNISDSNDDTISEISSAKEDNENNATSNIKLGKKQRKSKLKEAEKRNKKSEQIKHVDNNGNKEQDKNLKDKIVNEKQISKAVDKGITWVSVNFHAFVAPEFKLDPANHRFGIITSPGWDARKDMKPLKIISEFKEGYLVGGVIKFAKKSSDRSFEYKYVLEVESEEQKQREYLIEYLGEVHRNRVFKYEIENDSTTEMIERYDGLILPPDEGSEKSFFGWFKQKVKKIFTNYYNHSMPEKYESDAIEAMFYELEMHKFQKEVKPKWSNFSTASAYLNSVISGLNTFFSTTLNESKENKILRILIGMVSKTNDDDAKYIMALAILDFIGKTYFFNKFGDLYNEILNFLNVEQKFETDKIFEHDHIKIKEFVCNVKSVLYHVISNPLSLYLLDVVARMEFHEKINIDICQVYGSEMWPDFSRFMLEFSRKIQNESYFNTLNKMHKPSRLIFLSCIRGLFGVTSNPDFFKIFPLDVILSFLSTLTSSEWEKSSSQRWIVGNEDNIKFFLSILNNSVTKALKNDSHSIDYVKTLFDMSRNILLKTDKLSSILNHRRLLPLLVVIVLKVYVWCIMNLKQDENIGFDFAKEFVLKKMVEFHKYLKEEISYGKQLFLLKATD